MSRKKTFLVTFLVLSLVAFLAVGCSSSDSNGASETSANADDSDTIKIGINYELSGQTATYGTSSRDAILLAFEEINAAGGVLGKKIEPIIMDTKSDNKEAMMAATKLVTKDKVVAILGPATSGGVLSSVPVVEKYKIPLIANAATNADVTVDPETKETRPFVFRTCFIDPQQAMVGADFAYNELGKKKVAIYYDNTSDYSMGLAKVFEEHIQKLGGQVVAKQAYTKDDQEFRPTLTKFKNSGAELIYIPGYYEQVAKIISQAREVGLDVPLVGADGWDSPRLVEIAGKEALNNTYFTNHYSANDPAEHVQNFVKAFKEKYGEEPSAFATLGYDAAYILVDAIERANSLDPEKIRDEIEKTKDFQAVTGKYSFDENHNPIKEITIIELKDGVQTLKTKLYPEM